MSSTIINISYNKHIRTYNYRNIICILLLICIPIIITCYQFSRDLSYQETPCDIKYSVIPIDSDHDWQHRFKCQYTILGKSYKHSNCGNLPTGDNICYMIGESVLFHKP